MERSSPQGMFLPAATRGLRVAAGSSGQMKNQRINFLGKKLLLFLIRLFNLFLINQSEGSHHLQQEQSLWAERSAVSGRALIPARHRSGWCATLPSKEDASVNPF